MAVKINQDENNETPMTEGKKTRNRSQRYIRFSVTLVARETEAKDTLDSVLTWWQFNVDTKKKESLE